VPDSAFSKTMAPIGKFLEHVLLYEVIYMSPDIIKFDNFAEVLK